MKRGSHPIELLQVYGDLVPPETEIEFGIYRYTPDMLKDERRIERMKLSKGKAWFYSALPNADYAGHEIALQSRVYLPNGKIMHIPMCDLTGRRTDAEIARVCDTIAVFGSDRCFIFNSGKSYHIYGNKLIDEKIFVSLCAALILANVNKKRPIVDYRWVAHRLLAGYFALRLTKVSKSYRLGPLLLNVISGNSEHLDSKESEMLNSQIAFHI